MMKKENLRIFLYVALIAVGYFLFVHWEQDHLLEQNASKEIKLDSSTESLHQDLPVIDKKHTRQKERTEGFLQEEQIPESRKIQIKTDVLNVEVDLQGGDIIDLTLPEYPEKVGGNQGYQLLDDSIENKYYVVQSGLLNEQGPDSRERGRAIYKTENKSYVLSSDKDELNVDLRYQTAGGVDITKRFVFTRGSYLVKVKYLINNNSNQPYEASLYGRIKRTALTKESSGFMGMRTYTGAAVNTPEKAYKKISFDDMKKESFKETVKGGWAAMIEHYFTTAWIPDTNFENTYSSEKLPNDIFGIRFVSEPITVAPGKKGEVSARLYVGPEITSKLKKIAPGLNLTVDYGILWPICEPIFWILKNIHKIVGNWGVAIILTTLVIKLLFFKLSASSYKSMANMRKLQPKIEELKQRCGDDRQLFGQKVMELYRKEKVNPLGGCLPILVQIPVFIALYYVLLESVELRHAPFILWINDLSAKDPYYILPILMGLSMIVQQKLSPAPPDPVQAKVMMIMPVVFTFLFIQFPSGLVLYWVVNNILSIAQQWYITKKINKTI